MTIDTHQHFWNLRREPMPWMRPEHAAIAGDAAAHRILEDTPAHVYCLAESPGAVSVLGAGETDGCAH